MTRHTPLSIHCHDVSPLTPKGPPYSQCLVHGAQRALVHGELFSLVETREMQPLGKIERVRIPGCCTSRRVMEVSFPGDLDLRWKALLLAGAIIIRYESW
ncbi:hypothetical protein E2C01_033758 [Portunus trituberculatus]|uniref:Uncharacterized protein n=1 Tax=Portunus trituberculatus TaxID=210409 RepID=A0A5B7EZN9_PORTR|nr:hypothetical protein [Portunus trituberculatus]